MEFGNGIIQSDLSISETADPIGNKISKVYTDKGKTIQWATVLSTDMPWRERPNSFFNNKFSKIGFQK